MPLVAVVLLAGCSDGEGASHPTPAGSAPVVADSGSGDSARYLVASHHAHLTGLAFDARGDVLGIWALGWAAHPRQAYAVRAASGRVVVAAAPSASSLTGVVPGGWVVSSGDGGRHLSLVGRDALATPLRLSATPTRPRAGDVWLAAQRQLVYRPSTGRVYRLATATSAPRSSGGYVTPGGALVTVGSTPRRAAWATQRHRRSWSGRWRLGQSADAVTGTSNHVAVVLGRSLANGVDADRVTGTALSRDGGRTWRLSAAPPGHDEALGLVLMPDGTAFVATGSGPLLRARPGRRLATVPGIRPFSLTRYRDRLYALTAPHGAVNRPRLQVSTDDGRSWSQVPLPGRGH